jgi:hypothetical protein
MNSSNTHSRVWHWRPLISALACLSTLPMNAVCANADVRYVTEMSMAGADSDAKTQEDPADDKSQKGRTGGSIQTTTFIKDRRERVETNMNFGPFKRTSISITQCDKQQTIQMDPNLKIYTVAPIGGPPAAMPSGPMTRPGRAPRAEGKPGEAHVINTFSVQDMGKEKIGDLMTHHALITTRTQTSGCLGDSDNTVKMEVWTGTIKTFYCPERYTSGRTIPNERGCKVTYETRGDMDALKDVFGSMIVQQKIYQGDKVMMTQKLKDYSQDALDAGLFQPGADFKEVSAQEFAQAQQKAMMAQILHDGGQESDAPDAAKKEDDKQGDNKQGDEPPKKKKKKGFKIPGLP